MDIHHRSCLIVGAGLSGLIQAAELVRKGTLALSEIAILDRREGLGGVWRQATYPGAACDVQSHLYQVSWHRNQEWSEVYPSRDEILKYYQQFADQYKLSEITLYSTELTSAEWDEAELKWIVQTRNLTTDTLTTWTTDTLILATGIYREPAIPSAIPGFATYQGTMFHTSAWPADLDLDGKSVVYVGAGPTAVQAVPRIQPLAKHLTVVMRSIAYCMPRSNKPYSAWQLWVFRFVPFAGWLYSQLLALVLLSVAFAFQPASMISKEIEKMATKYLDDSVKDPELRKKLQPYGRFGSKRPLLSDDFYQALQRENVSVVNTGITEFTRDGVRVDNGPGGATTEIQADVIILGTGFQMQRWASTTRIIGLTGESLTERLYRNTSCLYGIAVPQFPNLFLLTGPNSTMPWYSVPWTSEIQATYISKLIRRLKVPSGRERRIVALMVNEEAAAQFTAGLQADLGNFSTDRKYGKSGHYVDDQGRNTTFYPYMPWRYWWALRRVDWGQFSLLRGRLPEDQ